MDAPILKKLVEDRAEKRAVTLATRLTDGIQKLVYPSEKPEENWLIEAASEVLASDKGRVVEGPDGEWFLNPFNPPLRLLLVGAVHIAQPLARIGALSGYDVTVVDPRTSFASEERFPDVHLVTDWPDEALAAFAPDARTAVVTLTHDPKLDDPALQGALRSPAFYIGALGSKKTHAARIARLTEAGFTDNEIARIHGPVGLAIGAKSPAEIAISVMAEITETLRT
ncbi:XdhC family protein [Parvibaculum sp.]|uniref:XdhC family protein n=1 Tax=Parvibaculum sp. TaxID=2024848 RepID=UPI001B264AB0|nr:XdhC family protein [Parvibaculum sp.]MBO6634299.1 XdhC family protein [Parvibaculum sp.]MBO6680277.1 XdhC family protein [Parvibaculum sp.]MBO6686573.1 XdhC family protein [Parvibaculum sp.]MBO6906016.1 XdhC family protein [Parvibaculum sp.]